MINFNAAQISLNAIGLPVQQNSNSISAGNNNFQAIINDILNNQINSEKAAVAGAISADPAAKASLFEAVSMLYLLGKVEAVSKLSTGEIANEPAVNTVIQNNNLSPEQAQLLANGIKITAIEIAAGNIPLLNNAAAQPLTGADASALLMPPANSPANNSQAPVNPAVINNPLTAAPAVIIPAQNQAVPSAVPQVIPVSINPASQVTQPAVPAANVPAAVIPEIVAAPAVVTMPAAKPVQVNSAAATVIPASGNATVIPVTPAAVSPVYKTETAPAIINALSGKIQSVNTSADKAAVVEEMNKLVAELSNVIKDFTALIYKLTEKNEDVPQEAKIINNKVTELANKLNELNATALDNGELVKAVTNEAADIIAVIAVALYKMNEAYLNSAAIAGTKNSGAEQADILLNSGTGAKQDYSSNKQITVAAGLTEEAKDLLTQIYGLLKKMNGELYMQQKTDYVYKPFSGSSSQVTKDGVLLINTAVTSGSPEAVMNNIVSGADKAAQRAAVNNQQVFVPAVENTGIRAAMEVAASVNADPVITKIQPAPVSNTAAVAQAAPVRTDIIPSIRNSEKAAMLLSESKNNYAKDVDWLKGKIGAYVVQVTGAEDAQLPVDVKVFEKAVDFAGRVKENIVIKQVVQNIQNAVQVSGKTEIKMFLRPDNMGPVIIKIDSSDKVISGKIEVANADVKQILNANLPELKAALASIGLNVNTLDVSIMNGYIGSGLSDSSNQFSEWEGSAMRPDAAETLENAGAINGVDGYLNFLA